MPTYVAGGVTATLSVSNLENSLTELKAFWQNQTKEIARVAASFNTGQPLEEKVIFAGGSNKGKLRHIGEAEDPWILVEAAEKEALLKRNLLKEASASALALAPELSTSDLQSPLETIDSPLASVSHGHPHAHPEPMKWHHRPDTVQPTHRQRAICLTVTTTPRTHISLKQTKDIAVDLKIDVFLNGDLAGVEFVNTKRSSMDNKLEFHGTRVQRQVEKPWIYDLARHTSEDEQAARAKSRWEGVSASLAEEASARRDTPCAHYLRSLSAVGLPEKFKEDAHLAIIDVIITTGNGCKYSPKKGYVDQVTRMDSKHAQSGGPDPADEGNLEQSPPRKESKIDHEPSQNQTIETEEASLPPEVAPAAELAQKRAELAINLSADPNGRLLDSIARQSPQRPPSRKAPPVQSDLSRSLSKLGESESFDLDGPDHSETEDAADSVEVPQTTTKPKKSRNSKPSHPKQERPGQKELEAFVIPEKCLESVVSYDPDPACHRQIKKIRPGMFEEDQVIVGMRFVLV